VSKKGVLREIFEQETDLFKVRVCMYAENNGGFIAGAYYVFQSTKKNDGVWKDIMEVHLDDPIDIPRENIYFIDNQIGYVFLKQQVALTKDSGATWNVWDARRQLPGWSVSPSSISSVKINNIGEGTMTLHRYADESSIILRTSDFGINWR
jgi:hypothetical protein